MSRKLRKCIVCGQEYEYCNNCKKYSSYPSWKTIYHDENCRNIMNIATEYAAGNIKKTEAKKKLDACDITNKNAFKESVLRVVNDIYYTKKVEKPTLVTSVEVDEETIIEADEVNVE